MASAIKFHHTFKPEKKRCADIVPFQMTYMLRLWRELRKPFVFPSSSTGFHTCEWEQLDIDLFACKLCGHVHACRDLQCVDTIETDDGTVCALSGVVIREKKYDVNEYQDTIDFTEFKPSYRHFEEEAIAVEIEFLIDRMINSKQTLRLLLKPTAVKIERLMKEKSIENLLHLSCSLSHILNHSNMLQVTSDEYKHIYCESVKHCKIVLRSMVTTLGMAYKQNELTHIIVGMLYLMRSGIMFENLIILPKLNKLEYILPPENSLNSVFDIRAKYLTETENRIKFCLRSTSKHKLQISGFKEQID